MPLTVNVEVPPRDHDVLASWVRSPSIRAGLAQRARIVLLAADGPGTNEIVRRTGASKPTVISWKRRYAAEGIGGLAERPGPASPGAPMTWRWCWPRWSRRRPAGGDALVVPAAGRRAGPVECEGRRGVAGVGAAALAGRVLQVLHRPPTRGQGPRRGTACTSTPRQGRRAVRRRETPGPGAGAGHRAASPGTPEKPATITSGTARPRCSPRWRSPPAR